MLREFNSFLKQHNVIGLAVAVVIGAAVGKLVSALVADLIMPVIGALTPQGNWRETVLQVGNIKFAIGDFIGAFFDFVIIAAVVFLLVKSLVREKAEKK